MSRVYTILPIATLVIFAAYLFFGKNKEATTSHAWNPIAPEEKNTFYSVELPTDISFAGERVPLEDPDVRERLDRELVVNTFYHSSTILMLKRANRWWPMIDSVLAAHQIPADFRYLPLIESGLENVVSPSNAVGFWQLLEGTGKDFGLEINKEVDERYDPLKSTVAACKFLRWSYNKLGSWTNVAGAYNMGVKGLFEVLSEKGENSYYDVLLNEETSRYVFRIIALKEIATNPEKYGYHLDEAHLYQPEKLRSLRIDTAIADLNDFAKQQGINYKQLKRYNPWLRKNKLPIGKGKVYTILVPEGAKS